MDGDGHLSSKRDDIHYCLCATLFLSLNHILKVNKGNAMPGAAGWH